ncbi:MAG: hypothetical protein IPG04_25495 [Polyangiaceae bacterium]|nr:hypothetical protein [Polyangiaceae bacterium]
MRSFGAALLFIAASVAVAPAGAQPKGGPSASASAPSAPPKPALDVPDAELPALPSLPSIRKEEPEPESIKALESLLARLTSEKKDIREAALKDLGKLGTPKPADPTKATAASAADEIVWAPAVRARVQEIRERLDRDRAPRVLADARKGAKKGMSKDELADAENADWLEFMLKAAAPKDDAWRDVVELLAMVRVLVAEGTTPAVRELIELRANFGDLLRIDLSRHIAKLKDRAVPALLEAKKHDATVVQRFADTELDRLGKVTPGEAVSTSDYEVLADTLRAFGYVKNEEAVDVLLSFANHDRRKIRQAAREAIAAIGEAGRWRLRDVYQDLTGEKIDKSLAWDIVARRIFAIYDKGRVAELWHIFTSGLDASKAGQHSAAVEAFDKVLARDPLFERRREMTSSYFAHAKTIGFDKAEDRLAMLRKAKRLDPQGAEVSRIDAEIAYSEAKVLIEEGRPDRFLVKRAVELDPDHIEAKALLDSFEEQALGEPAPPPPRYGLAGAIAGGTVALMGLVALFLLRRPAPKRRPGGPTQPPPDREAPDPAS